jgi:hypothetical protein
LQYFFIFYNVVMFATWLVLGARSAWNWSVPTWTCSRPMWSQNLGDSAWLPSSLGMIVAHYGTFIGTPWNVCMVWQSEMLFFSSDIQPHWYFSFLMLPDRVSPGLTWTMRLQVRQLMQLKEDVAALQCADVKAGHEAAAHGTLSCKHILFGHDTEKCCWCSGHCGIPACVLRVVAHMFPDLHWIWITVYSKKL